jgi:hypothetical protein
VAISDLKQKISVPKRENNIEINPNAIRSIPYNGIFWLSVRKHLWFLVN